MSEQPHGHRLHLGIAEQGKIHALAGDHGQALRCYRDAIQIAVRAGAPEVFFRHYMECTLESLEKMGSFVEVLEYADRAIAHYGQFSPISEEQRLVVRVDLVAIHQRRGVVLLKMGRLDEARQALEKARSLAREVPVIELPLAETLIGWMTRGFHVDTQRVMAEQEARRYFSVRTDTVDTSIAIAWPASKMEVPQHG